MIILIYPILRVDAWIDRIFCQKAYGNALSWSNRSFTGYADKQHSF